MGAHQLLSLLVVRCCLLLPQVDRACPRIVNFHSDLRRVHQILCDDPAHFELMLQALLVDDVGVQQAAWTLLQQVPVPAPAIAELQLVLTAEEECDVDWGALFPATEPHRLLYRLCIVRRLFDPSNTVSATLPHPQWPLAFGAKHGLNRLLNVLLGCDVEAWCRDWLRQRCLRTLLDMIVTSIAGSSDSLTSCDVRGVLQKLAQSVAGAVECALRETTVRSIPEVTDDDFYRGAADSEADDEEDDVLPFQAYSVSSLLTSETTAHPATEACGVVEKALLVWAQLAVTSTDAHDAFVSDAVLRSLISGVLLVQNATFRGRMADGAVAVLASLTSVQLDALLRMLVQSIPIVCSPSMHVTVLCGTQSRLWDCYSPSVQSYGHEASCPEFYRLLCEVLLKSGSAGGSAGVNFQEVFNFVTALIIAHPSLETTTSTRDWLLSGLLCVARCLVTAQPSLKVAAEPLVLEVPPQGVDRCASRLWTEFDCVCRCWNVACLVVPRRKPNTAPRGLQRSGCSKS